MENIKFKIECEICGEEIIENEFVMVEESYVCCDKKCIEDEGKRIWYHDDK